MRYLEFRCIVVLAIALLASCHLQDGNRLTSYVHEISLPTGNTSETPNLYVHDDTIHMIWTQSQQDTTILYYTRLIAEQELSTTMVAQGADWFVNWADFSSITLDDEQPNNIITHWLEKSDHGTYDYDVKLSMTRDGGLSWSLPKTLHNDGVAAEHGFVSMTNYDKDHFYATWLDGRNTKTTDPNDPDKTLPMTIRGALIHKEDLSITSFEIDEKVCDCCQTSTIVSSEGILTAYRDRTDDEVRDIVVRKVDGHQSEVLFKSKDNWKINGCPVNGPALASNDKWNAVAWYTVADSAEVKLAYGQRGTFDHQIKIDNGNPTGRVDIEIADNIAYISWLELKDQRAEIRLKTIDLLNNQIINDQLIAPTSPERRSGFPIIKLADNYIYLTHTAILTADHTAVRLKRIKR